MSFTKWFIFVAFAFAPLTLVAQQQNSPPDPADPKAAVVTYMYESTFNNYKPMATSAATPDAVWQSANKGLGTAGDAPMDHSNHQNKGK